MDYAQELFPYGFTCDGCGAEQQVTRREAIDYGGHLARPADAAEFALYHKHGWAQATPFEMHCPTCASGDLRPAESR